jgi:hypothetical protein
VRLQDAAEVLRPANHFLHLDYVCQLFRTYAIDDRGNIDWCPALEMLVGSIDERHSPRKNDTKVGGDGLNNRLAVHRRIGVEDSGQLADCVLPDEG